MAPLPADAAALLALLALLVLPGLVIVRSPSTFVPFLSVGFWLSTWLLPMGQGRSSFLVGWLFVAGTLVLLRLPRLPARLLPRWPTAVVFLAAAVELVPLLVWAVPPGTDAAFFSVESRLLSGADGIPASDRPLGEVGFVLPTALGVPALAADVSLLSGIPPERAVLIVSLAARGLLTVALYGLARRFLGDPRGAMIALSAAGLSRIVLVPASGAESVPLAGALGLAAVTLLLRGEGKAPAVASGLFLAGSLVADPLTAVLCASAVVLLAAAGPPPRRARCLLTLFVATVGFLGAGLRWHGAWARAGSVGRLVPVSVLDEGRWWAMLGLVVCVALVAAFARWPSRPLSSAALGGLLLAAATAAGAEAWTRQSRVLLDWAAVEEWKVRADPLPPLSRICSEPDPGRAWVPALTGRGVDPGWRPAWITTPGSRSRSAPCLPLPVRAPR